MLDRLFLAHPRSVGEDYLEHQRRAFGFGAQMIRGGVACLLHGLVPALCETTGSRTVRRLHQGMVTDRRAPAGPAGGLRPGIAALVPGLALAAAIGGFAAWAGAFLHAPQALLALLAGACAGGMGRSAAAPGVAWSAGTGLRIGVALLGATFAAATFAEIGWQGIVFTVAVVAASLGLGLLIGRLAGLSTRDALVSAGAVSICGASAALAMAEVTPRRAGDEAGAAGTVAIVTALGTLAMAGYPLLGAAMGLAERPTALLLGASLHEVAQVAGAGFGVSPRVGELAMAIKLVRVACLAPVALAAWLWFRGREAADGAHAGDTRPRPPPVPLFLLGFALLAGAASLGLVPAAGARAAAAGSHGLLLIALAALGMRISPKAVIQAGPRPLIAIGVQSLLLLGLVLGGIALHVS